MVHIVQSMCKNVTRQLVSGGQPLQTCVHFDIFLQKHFVFAVGEACVQFLRFLQQPLLLRIIKAVDLQVCIPIECPPLHWLVC